jgi:hypothetical protein
LNVAVDYDQDFINFGGIPKAYSIMQDVDFIYFRDLKLRVNVSWIASSPFTFSNTTNFSILSGEFWTYWDANRGNINRDITHMFTGKNLTVPDFSAVSNGESNQVSVGSATKSYSMSDGGNETNLDWASCASHEIAHNLTGFHDDSGNFIMNIGNGKNGEFSAISISQITGFLNSNSSLGIRNPSILPQLNYVNINTTPAYISSNGQTLNIVNNDTYVNNNSFIYSANNPSVGYNQGSNPTFLSLNGAAYFTFTIQYNNICGTFFRSIPLIARNSSARIYPNPTDETLNIDSENGDWKDNPPREIRVYDEQQNLIHQQITPNNLQGNSYQINFKSKSKGKYFVHILYPDGSVKQQQIILNK